MPGIVIAAPASGQGKTTFTLGLLRAFRRRGLVVCSAKSGPDYIDTAFHAAASGAPCVNLDSWAAGPDLLRSRAEREGLLVVEGAMGLLDAAFGAPPGGPGSVQAVAEALALPVILVVDAARMGQSIAALVDGFNRAGRPLAGVVLNRVGSTRHAQMLRDAVAPVTEVLGILPSDKALVLPSRHLGLVQAAEHADLEGFIERAAERVAEGCDLDRIAGVAQDCARPDGGVLRLRPPGQRIAVARDEAFAFAYTHMLEDWRGSGAEIVPFSPLGDEAPDPAADAVFLPGGYPELHAGRLAGATGFFTALKHAAGCGTLIYGECGGYMVLGEGLIDKDGGRHRMAGLLHLETSFAEPTRHLGYRKLEAREGPLAGRYRGHEFHYARTIRAVGAALFEACDAAGEKSGPMGLINGSVMGSFAHIIEAVD